MRSNESVDIENFLFIQLVTRKEWYHLPFGNGHWGSSLGIAPTSRWFIPNSQSAERDKFYRFTGNQGVFHDRKNRINNFPAFRYEIPSFSWTEMA